jgi:hypothetical protein
MKELYTTLLFPLLRTSDVLAFVSSNDDTGNTTLLTSRLTFDGYTVLQYSLDSLRGCNSFLRAYIPTGTVSDWRAALPCVSAVPVDEVHISF